MRRLLNLRQEFIRMSKLSETVILGGNNIPDVYRDIESEVRRYCRAYPVEFGRAKGSYLYDRLGRPYLDFLSGCGSLNYGHIASQFASRSWNTYSATELR